MSSHCPDPMNCPECNPTGETFDERVARIRADVAEARRVAVWSDPPHSSPRPMPATDEPRDAKRKRRKPEGTAMSKDYVSLPVTPMGAMAQGWQAPYNEALEQPR